MSLFDLYVTAGSLLVVAALSLLALAMGFRTRARIGGPEEVEALMREAEPGAGLSECFVGADGRAGLARLADGRLLVARALGDKVSVRTFPPAKVRVCLENARVVLAFADLGFPQLHLALGAGETPAWLAALAETREQ